MRRFLFSAIMLFMVSVELQAQNDLLDELSATETDSTALLPTKIIFTQRLLWGEKGLMRSFDRFELTAEKRQQELKTRRLMLKLHQVCGFLTLEGMLAQAIVGTLLVNKPQLKETHEGLAVGVNIGYTTTASLSLFAPPKMYNDGKGYSSIKAHRILAIVHMSGLIATNILAGQMESDPSLIPYHRVAAYTTFAALATSMIVIKF